MATIPSQKTGAACPSRANILNIVSRNDPFFTAVITPSGSPIRKLTSTAIAASFTVAGSLSRTSSSAGARSPLIDLPRSPLNALPIKMAYCSGRGLSRPSCLVRSSLSSSVLYSVSSKATGSPVSLPSIKTITLTKNSVITA